MARLPGLPNPLAGLERLGRYAWRDPKYDQRGNPIPYSGMGLGSFAEDTIKGLNPITQAQDTWRYRPEFLGGEKYTGPVQMIMPIGGRWAPRTPGLRAESLQKGDPWVDYVGDRDAFKAPRDPDGETLEAMQGWQSPARRGYNLRNEKNEIVASADAIRGLPGDRNKYVPSIWVREDYRKTPAFNDLRRIISREGKFGIRGEITNPRLAELERRRTDPERLKVLKAVAKVPAKKPRKETQLDRDIRELRQQAEHGRRFQATNRDVGHPLTPVRRPVQPRPPKPIQLTPSQQQARLSAELKQRRRGGV